MATERQAYWQGTIDKYIASGLTKADFLSSIKLTQPHTVIGLRKSILRKNQAAIRYYRS